MLIANMDVNFENIVTELVQMTQEVAQMTKEEKLCQISLKLIKNLLQNSKWEYDNNFQKFCHKSEPNVT